MPLLHAKAQSFCKHPNRPCAYSGLDQEADELPAKLNSSVTALHLLQERIPGGVVKIRPLHPEHTFEVALVCTEAFEISVDPPRFDMML